MAMLREFSAGALVLRYMQKQWWIAVIEPGRHCEPEDRKDVLALPKGNVDPGEKPEQAAFREVLEETGIHAKTITRLANIRYVYSRKWTGGEKIFKVVTFYLMKYHSGRIGQITDEMKHEVRRAFWLPLPEAAGKLSYKGEKQMARQAQEYVQAHAEELLLER
ncbi:MAG TPA: NUDIX domain-containing protein [Candidatus Angelobacter sp.]|nr:NUDIX domain-containing protein [Candidatus Angelobacter sp.]